MRTTPFRVGAALAITVGAGYALCTIVFAAFPDAAARFMTALFHGLDFGVLRNDAAFTVGSFLYALMILMGWSFGLGTLFTYLAARMLGDRDAAPTWIERRST